MTPAAAPPRPPDAKDLLLFFAVAFGGAWGLAGGAWLAGVKLGPLTAIAIGVPYMYFPALGAWLAERRRGARVLETLEVRFTLNRWWLAAWLLPVGLSFATLGVGLLLPGVEFAGDFSGLLERLAAQLPAEKLAEAKAKLGAIPFPLLVAAQAGQALVAGITINAVAAFGEELGWRGYLQRAVGPLGFWKGSALVGLAWGPWHAALILQGYNYPQHPVLGVAMMTAMTVLLSPLLAAVRAKGGSVLAAAVGHGSFNASAGFAIMLLKGGDDLLVGVTGLAGLIVLSVANLVLWVVLRGESEARATPEPGPLRSP